MATALEYLKECPVCQEEYTDPRVFPCDHSLCLDCIGQIKKGNKIKCPECNAIHDVRQVRRDFRLMQFLDALKEEKESKTPEKQDEEPLCDVCLSENASHWCNDCKQWLCKGCKKTHSRIAATKNHKLEPVSRKIEDIKRKYAQEMESIKARSSDSSVKMKRIEDQLSELEVCQIEALETSDKLRKKTIKDIEEYFDSIDGKIISFVQDRSTKLEKTRDELRSLICRSKSDWQSIEEMIQNNSRRLLTEGEAILMKVKQAQQTLIPMEFDQQNFVIEVAKGISWNPAMAATLNMKTEINTKVKTATLAKDKLSHSATNIPAKPSKSPTTSPAKQFVLETEPPNLSALATQKFKKSNEVRFSRSCIGLRVINNQLWSCKYETIEILDKSLKRIKTLQKEIWGQVWDVTVMSNVGIIIACDKGLININDDGDIIKEIDYFQVTSADIYKGTLYAASSNIIRSYTYSDDVWVKQRQIKLPRTDFTTISVKADRITVSYHDSNIIDNLNMSGKKLHTYDFKQNRIGDMLLERSASHLCQANSEGALLVADYGNNRLQLLDKRRQWNIVAMEPAPLGPNGAVYFDDSLYVQCYNFRGDAWVLYKYISI